MESSNNIIAPFVLKTYQIVDNPLNGHLITWGKANNSFIVVDPLEFSLWILPAHFKHNNFSSFVRQLSTYRFRKVDPDRWEFANEWFLRGQKHLLKNIVRRKHSPRALHPNDGSEEDAEGILSEIERLKREQHAMERELQDMTKRLEATEKRPEQMLAFLFEVVEEPDILPRMILERERRVRPQLPNAAEKNRRLMEKPSYSAKTKKDDGSASIGAISLPDANFEAQAFCGSSQSPENNCTSAGWFIGGPNLGRPLNAAEPHNLTVQMNYPFSVGPDLSTVTAADVYDMFGGHVCCLSDLPADSLPPYPFSMFDGGFQMP
ncbi:hypothetical protein Nepgr_019869 [Nepenthes gracilis]|uniref:HSF-type DNA-binding domain-containing protein n=1 Tax=Nepenthes gracilis TaxID=150966 RepID=A0AAD3XUS5_NEPGR|nr:hypothetical protein Nepgr_019869 [Nepenthes gracilis]